ncbi:MAG TPA: hypothetical protein DIC51_01680 [Coxiellaceae bacterium]|nr:hypothetical protein [Coxiellaceae bacterium]
MMTKILMISLIGFAVMASGIVLASSAFAQSGDYADWMSQHKDQLRNLPINQVPILGSHDAGTSDLSTNSPISQGRLIAQNVSPKYYHPTAKLVKQAKAQSVSILQQLNAGARFLDLRVTYQDGAYYSEHLWISTPYFGSNGIFTQIKTFLQNHPDEILILDIPHLLSENAVSTRGVMDTDEATIFYRLIVKEFSGLLIPRDNPATLTMGHIWSTPGRIILISEIPSSDPAINRYIWNRHDVLDARWMAQPDPETLIEKLNQVIDSWNQGQYRHQLRALAAMVTSRPKNPKWRFDGLISAAATTNAQINEQLQTNWKNAPINIVLVDDVARSGLMPTLLNRLSQPAT